MHLDGFNFMPYFQGKEEAPRKSFLYFTSNGELNAVRWNDWKLNFSVMEGNLSDAVRQSPNWPQIINLRADPFEKGPHESSMYLRWMADNMWLFVPIQDVVGNFLSTLPDYPMQSGHIMNPSSVGYQSLDLQGKMKQLEQLEKKVYGSK